MRKFYLTTFTIQVLREHAPFDSSANAQEIHDEITTGDSVGLVHEESVEELTPDQAAEKALELGSDGGFFGLGEEDEEDEEGPSDAD